MPIVPAKIALMCCTIRLMATEQKMNTIEYKQHYYDIIMGHSSPTHDCDSPVFSAPRGIITSAYFFVYTWKASLNGATWHSVCTK